jgi:hypothetical protein
LPNSDSPPGGKSRAGPKEGILFISLLPRASLGRLPFTQSKVV